MRLFSGGEKGIRTLDTVPRIHDFQSCALDQLSHLSMTICPIFALFRALEYNTLAPANMQDFFPDRFLGFLRLLIIKVLFSGYAGSAGDLAERSAICAVSSGACDRGRSTIKASAPFVMRSCSFHFWPYSAFFLFLRRRKKTTAAITITPRTIQITGEVPAFSGSCGAV